MRCEICVSSEVGGAILGEIVLFNTSIVVAVVELLSRANSVEFIHWFETEFSSWCWG